LIRPFGKRDGEDLLELRRRGRVSQ
jgi:hypothetical protein